MLHALLTGLALAALPTASLVQEADPNQAAREAAFARLLTGARLEGYTTLTDGDGNLMGTELEADSYDLAKVEKGEDGKWRFTALINYGGRPIPISVSLPVEWAGDTPVIDVEDMKVPFMGTYSARVLFDGDRYVGVWRGDGYGGHILGKVVRAEPEEPTTTIHWPQFRGRPP